MSRIGNHPVAVPSNVTVSYDDKVITVKGPLGTLTQDYDSKAVVLSQENGHVIIKRTSEQKPVKAKHGLYRALIANMVEGVTKGYEKGLIVNGVGYKVIKSGNKITLSVGFSHTVEYEAPAGVTVDCPSQTEITVKGIDKVAVGQAAANIRAIKKPEPYHIYGIRYKDEVIQKKEGKTAGK